MTRIGIRAIGVLAPGLEGWACARDVLAGRRAFEPGEVRPPPSPLLPPAERRRLNANSAWALAVASEALDAAGDVDRGRLACVFATADGDGEVLAQSLDVLASRPLALSPTLFHNSVFNAPAGYWTIASGANGPSITVSAGTATFAAGMIEAGVEIASGGAPVLFIAFDMTFPESLRSFGVEGEAFACALLLGPESPAPAWGRIEHWERPARRTSPSALPPALAPRFRGNAAAAALPLLAAIAARTPTGIAVPYHDGDCLELRYTP